MSTSRIIIAGTHSGVGKTSVSLAVMAGLTQSGYQVQAYKVGPDYIDASYHAVATGRPSHNLDDWMMGGRVVEWLFQESSKDCDIAVIEGVMGLFDGISGINDEGSTAKIAKLLKTPIILVVDARSMARSVAAIIRGYQTLDSDLKISGVILNRVASHRHLEMLSEAIAFYNHIPVVGALFRDAKMMIPQRHLGLKTAAENTEFQSCLKHLASLTSMENKEPSCISLKSILEISKCEPLKQSIYSPMENITICKDIIIAYASDKAFNFYYQANLDFLRDCGARLISFSPLEDIQLPKETAALYFGGGFPEMYAQELEANKAMRQVLGDAIQNGMPVYAECGGLIYLTQSIKTFKDESFQMVGAIPGNIEMTDRLVNFGYTQTRLVKDCFLGQKDEKFRGHEFHYSRWDNQDKDGTDAPHFVKKRNNCQVHVEGYVSDTIFASYIHCHFLSYSQRAMALIKSAENYIKSKERNCDVCQEAT